MFFRINRFPDPTPPAGDSPGPIKVDHSTPPPAYTPPDIKMAEALAPEFRDKPYFKDKDFVGIIKDHVNLQTLLGQRPTGMPKDDAPAEEWDKFLGSIRPKAVDEYTFPETDFSKAGKRNPGYEKALRDLAYESGVPKKYFEKFAAGVEKHLFGAEQLTETQKAEAAKARELEFEGLLDKTYSKDKQAVIDRTKKLMLESVDPAMKDQVGNVLKDVSNEVLFALTAVLDGVWKKHIAEDNSPSDKSTAGSDILSLESEAHNIMKSDAYKDFRVPGHEAAKEKVAELFKQIAALKK